MHALARIATWCFQRIAFDPPRANEPVDVIARFLASTSGQVVHAVPQDGLSAERGWIREIEDGTASWTLRAEAQPTPYIVQIRHRPETFALSLLVGQRIYEPACQVDKKGRVRFDVRLRGVKLSSWASGIPALGLRAWLVGYLVLAIPLVAVLRRVLGVH